MIDVASFFFPIRTVGDMSSLDMRYKSNFVTMITIIKHLPSGKVYENRKDAKIQMGHSAYNKALHEGQMLFLTTYSPIDIIF